MLKVSAKYLPCQPLFRRPRRRRCWCRPIIIILLFKFLTNICWACADLPRRPLFRRHRCWCRPIIIIFMYIFNILGHAQICRVNHCSAIAAADSALSSIFCFSLMFFSQICRVDHCSPAFAAADAALSSIFCFFNLQWGLIVKKHTTPVHVSPSLYLFLCLLGWIDFLSIIFCVPWLCGRGEGLKASVCDIAQELKSQFIQYKTSWSFSHGFSRLVWSIVGQIASWQWVTV